MKITRQVVNRASTVGFHWEGATTSRCETTHRRLSDAPEFRRLGWSGVVPGSDRTRCGALVGRINMGCAQDSFCTSHTGTAAPACFGKHSPRSDPGALGARPRDSGPPHATYPTLRSVGCDSWPGRLDPRAPVRQPSDQRGVGHRSQRDWGHAHPPCRRGGPRFQVIGAFGTGGFASVVDRGRFGRASCVMRPVS